MIKNDNKNRSTFSLVTPLLGCFLDKNSSRWTYKTVLEEIGMDVFNIIDFFFVLEDELQIELDLQPNILQLQWTTIGELVATIDSRRFAAQHQLDHASIRAA